MAEIRIEKKKPVWPWVLVALLIIGIIAAFFLWDDDDRERDVADDTRQEEQYNEDRTGTATYDTGRAENLNNEDTAPVGSQNAVKEFTDHVNNENGQMGKDHEYTHQGFTKLSSALAYMSRQKNYDLSVDLSKIDTWADEIQREPSSLEHADKIKKGMKEVLTAFQNLQKNAYPKLEGEIDDLKDNYNDWDPQKPTLDQKKVIKSFFDEAAEILGKMERENEKKNNK